MRLVRAKTDRDVVFNTALVELFFDELPMLRTKK